LLYFPYYKHILYTKIYNNTNWQKISDKEILQEILDFYNISLKINKNNIENIIIKRKKNNLKVKDNLEFHMSEKGVYINETQKLLEI
jgi:hypothetical protein